MITKITLTNTNLVEKAKLKVQNSYSVAKRMRSFGSSSLLNHECNSINLALKDYCN